ncbi:hypothetical protein AB2939_003643 [Escherichia coli]
MGPKSGRIKKVDIRNMAEELNALKTELVGEEVYKDAKGEKSNQPRKRVC